MRHVFVRGLRRARRCSARGRKIEPRGHGDRLRRELRRAAQGIASLVVSRECPHRLQHVVDAPGRCKEAWQTPAQMQYAIEGWRQRIIRGGDRIDQCSQQDSQALAIPMVGTEGDAVRQRGMEANAAASIDGRH